MKGKIIKLLENNIREYIHKLGTGKDFLKRTPKRTNIKKHLIKMNIQMKKFRSSICTIPSRRS